MDVSWTIKKAEVWRINAFKLWCWRRLLDCKEIKPVPWTARRSNLSILKEVNPEYSSEVLLLKLKLLYFGHLIRRADSLEKTLMLGEKGSKVSDGYIASSTQWTWFWVNSGSWWWTGRLGVLQFMGSQRVGYDWATENWTDVEDHVIWKQREFYFLFSNLGFFYFYFCSLCCGQNLQNYVV